MRLALLILAAGALLLAGLPAAHADPVSLGLAAINAILGTTLTATTALVTTAAGTTLLTVGQAISAALAVGFSVAASLLGGGGRGGQIDPTQAKSTFESNESPELRCVGRVRIGGLKAYGNTAGSSRFRLIAHSRGPASAVEAHFLGGREVTVEADGAVSSPPYARPNGSYIYIRSKAGDGAETSWPQLQSAFPGLWTAEHRLRGIAQTLIEYVSPGLTSAKFQKMYQGGAPDYERVQRGEPVYDPRCGCTIWSDNGILCALHVALSFPELSLDDFDLPAIAAEANRADAIVTTRAGSEPRARAWGIWSSETPRATVLEAVLRSIGAEIIETAGGKLAFRLIDDNRPAEITIPAQHIIDVKLRYGPESVERPNIARLKYYSPERNYEIAEINLAQSPWSRAQGEIERAGDQITDLEYAFCPSAAQAQRIARREFATARADSGVVVTNLAGLACWGLRTVAFELPDIGLTVCEIAAPRVNERDGTVEIPFVVQPALSPWAPLADESPAPDEVPEQEYQSALATPAAVNAALVVTYPSGASETRFGYADQGAGLTVEAVHRTYTGALPNAPAALTEWRAPAGASMGWLAGSLVGQQVDARLRVFNAEEDGSRWSPWAHFTLGVAGAVPAAPALSVTPDEDWDFATFTFTSPADLGVTHIVWAVSANEIDWTAQTAIQTRPGEVHTRSFDLPPGGTTGVTRWFRAAAVTAAGQGAFTTITVNVPGSGGE